MNKKSNHQELIDRMTADGRSGNISRRDFMRFSIAAGMSVSAAAALWTSGVAAATPKRGGTFRLGSFDGNTSDTHDPGTYLSFKQYSTRFHAPQLPYQGASRQHTWPRLGDVVECFIRCSRVDVRADTGRNVSQR